MGALWKFYCCRLKIALKVSVQQLQGKISSSEHSLRWLVSINLTLRWSNLTSSEIIYFTLGKVKSLPLYKARHAHKRLYTVLPKYSKIQVPPGITSCRLVKDNKQAIELNSLLLNNMPKDGYG